MVVATIHAWNDNVVMRISIIFDEYAALFTACELNNVRVNRLDWGEEGFTFVYNDNIFFIICCCGKFRVNMMSNGNITAGYGKFNSMRVVYFRLVWLMMLWQMAWAARELIKNADTMSGILLDNFAVSMTTRIVWILHSWNNDVIVRVTVIGNENTTSESTCKFKLVWINLVDRGNNGSAINLNDSFCWRYGSSCKFWVNMNGSLDVTSSLDEFNTVRADLLFDLRVMQ